MAVEFFIPKLGQTVEEVTIIDWLVKNGDSVEQGQPILEVETDKSVFPVEANASGIIHMGPFNKGDMVPVITTVAIIGKPEDQFPGTSAAIPQIPNGLKKQKTEIPAISSKSDITPTELSTNHFISPRARKLANEKQVDLRLLTPTGGEGVRIIEKDVQDYLAHMPKLTPVARRVAEELGVTLEDVSGSGPGGRITRADIERASQFQSTSLSDTMVSTDLEVLERIPLSGVRSLIAERMALSVNSTARVTLIIDVNASQLVQMRERLKERLEKEWGFTPGYNDLLAKIVAMSLRNHPYMNARLTEDAIFHLKPINLGMAVDTDRGLIVPVIRNADQKSLRQFGLEFRQLVERARLGKSLPDDLSGGTFTITNLGTFGVDAFTPIINYPEAAILGVGKIAERAVAIEGKLEVCPTCTLSLVFDHRLVDGAPAARFLAYIKELIEDPYLLVAELTEL